MFVFKRALVLFYLGLVSTPLIQSRMVEAPPTTTTMATTSPSWDSIFRMFLGDYLDVFVSIFIYYLLIDSYRVN